MGQAPSDDVKAIAAVEREVDELRERTQALIEELERRVRDGVDRAKHTVERVRHAVDVPAHLKKVPVLIKRNPKTAGGIGAGLALALGFGIFLSVRRRRRMSRPMARVQRHLAAYRQILADPRSVIEKKSRPLHHRLLTALLVTAATALTKTLFAMAVKRLAVEPKPALPALPAPGLYV